MLTSDYDDVLECAEWGVQEEWVCPHNIDVAYSSESSCNSLCYVSKGICDEEPVPAI